MSDKNLKPWQQNESRWLLTTCATHGYQDLRRLSNKTGWSLPTLRAKLIKYQIMKGPKAK